MKLLAWTLSALLASSLAAATEDSIKEPVTGKTFSAHVEGAAPGSSLVCTGVACRKKTAFGVKVYAIAHWIDPTAASSTLAQWEGKAGAQLASDQSFFDALCAADAEKRLELVFVRSVDASDIRAAFKESLDIAYGGPLSPSAEQFLALFTTDVKNGQTIVLRSLPGGAISAEQNGAVLGTLPADRTLASAVWAIYFHEKLADGHLQDIKPLLVSRFDAAW